MNIPRETSAGNPISTSEQDYARLDQLPLGPGAALGFKGATQRGYGPEMWGITLQQLLDVHSGAGGTMRSAVANVIKPRTIGTNVGYALLLNAPEALRARVMVSHSWDEIYNEFIAALQSSGGSGPFWVCAMALCQNNEPAMTIEMQLGPPEHVMYGPFATVLRQANKMVAIVESHGSLYTRMWCIFEMFVAIQLKVKVTVAHFAESKINKPGYGFEEVSFNIPIEEQAIKPINCLEARCGNPLNEMNDDERNIRKYIEDEMKGGYQKIDTEIEKLRLDSVLQGEVLHKRSESDDPGSMNPYKRKMSIKARYQRQLKVAKRIMDRLPPRDRVCFHERIAALESKIRSQAF